MSSFCLACQGFWLATVEWDWGASHRLKATVYQQFLVVLPRWAKSKNRYRLYAALASIATVDWRNLYAAEVMSSFTSSSRIGWSFLTGRINST